MAGHAGSFWATSARAAGAVPGAAPWLARCAAAWSWALPGHHGLAAGGKLSPGRAGGQSRACELLLKSWHLAVLVLALGVCVWSCGSHVFQQDVLGQQLCLLLPGTGPGWWAARMDHDHLAEAGASKQSIPCHPAGWSSVLELRVTAQIPCLSQSSLRDNKPESRLTYICFIIKLMRLFSLLYAPLNSVFEILRRAGALQSGHALRSSATLVVFVLEHPNHAAAACSLGSLSLQRLVRLRDECSVCYCYLFSLFFPSMLSSLV